jgi:hypothetical protein
MQVVSYLDVYVVKRSNVTFYYQKRTTRQVVVFYFEKVGEMRMEALLVNSRA